MIPYLQVRITLNGFGRGRFSLHSGARHNGYRVFSAKPKLEWAQTANTGLAPYSISRLSHRPRDIFCAWRDGRLIASKVIWYCGGYTFNFRLQSEPTRMKCSMCEFKYKREKEKCSPSPLFLEPS